MGLIMKSFIGLRTNLFILSMKPFTALIIPFRNLTTLLITSINGCKVFAGFLRRLRRNSKAPPSSIFLKKSSSVSKIPFTGFTAFSSFLPEPSPSLVFVWDSSVLSLACLFCFCSRASSCNSSFLSSFCCLVSVSRILSMES